MRNRALTAIGLPWVCLCFFWLPGFAAAQESDVADSSPSAASRDADPLSTAERLLSGPPPAADDASYGRALIETARAVGRTGELETALQLLTKALDHYRSGPLAEDHRAILTARLGTASAAWQLGKHELVIQQADELLRLPSDGSDLAQRVAAQQLLARALQQLGRFDRSLEVIAELAQASAAATRFAVEHALVIGGAALRSRQLTVAAEAYQFYLTHSPQGSRTADAVLGLAWASAMGAEPPEQAEQRLADFVASFPDHQDIPHALRAQANLLQQLDRGEDAQRISLQLIGEYPASDAALAMLEDVLLSSPPPWPDVVRVAWLDRLGSTAGKLKEGAAEAGREHSLRTELIERSLVGALASSDDMIWQATVDALLRSDADGSQSRLLLASLAEAHSGAEAQNGHVAEHLAVDLLGRIIDCRTAEHSSGQSASGTAAPAPRLTVPAACEAACQWAGLTGRWSMLALVADQLRPATQPPGRGSTNPRGLAIDRMLAESLMQTRRSQDAVRWWDAIIDVQGADDFATLLRGAEASVAHGPLGDAATRLSTATAAAGDDPFRLSLLKILEAELAIRKAQMDEARALLSTLLRASDSAAELRPRAQWMIGETYFLQARYADAIDAYRRVDALDAEGEWAAAALLQAGKAFEKLARSREAATCYTALASRFGDTPHAAQARTRLAHLGGSDSGDAPLRR